jgi:SAM-dependent methyltransferase
MNASYSPFNDLALEYDTWFDEEGKLIFNIELKALQYILPVIVKPWLEIGVGSGRFAQALGIDSGIDPSEKLVSMACNRGINAIVGMGEEHYFNEQSFGAVFLILTLCFLESPAAVLREAHRLLMSDGRLVLGLVLKESPWGQFYTRQKEGGHKFYRYANFYSLNEIARFTTEAGFVAENMLSTLFQPPGQVNQTEEFERGYFADAGFTVIAAKKRHIKNVSSKDDIT